MARNILHRSPPATYSKSHTRHHSTEDAAVRIGVEEMCIDDYASLSRENA